MNPSAEFWYGKRVFVTGHTGFKGGWLVLWLERLGARVRGFALAPDTVPNLCDAAGIERHCESVRGDVRQADALRGELVGFTPDIVLHLAAQALVQRGYRQPAETFETNVMGTVHVLEAVRHAPSVRVAIIVTSDKCYDNREWLWPYRENDAIGGHDPYSASKACAELVAAAWRRSFLKAAGAAVASARAGNVIGGGDWAENRLIPDCVRALVDGRPISIRNPAATRPWQHVLEPLCGYLLLAEQAWADPALASEAWNFGPSADDAQPVSRIADTICQLWGHGARWTTAGTPQAHEAGMLAVDAARARAHLGWTPRLPVAEAVAWAVRWYKDHQAGRPADELVLRDIASYEARAASVP